MYLKKKCFKRMNIIYGTSKKFLLNYTSSHNTKVLCSSYNLKTCIKNYYFMKYRYNYLLVSIKSKSTIHLKIP